MDRILYGTVIPFYRINTHNYYLQCSWKKIKVYVLNLNILSLSLHYTTINLQKECFMRKFAINTQT